MTDNSATSNGSRAVDFVISNATVVTMNARREVLREAEIVISDRRIVKVGPATRGGKVGVRKQLDARGKVVVPGFIHGHLHACQTLCRNRADGLELLDWLRERIWPHEAAHDAESMRAAADLTFLELIKSGATGLLDMGSVHHYDQVFESARDCGIRLTGGKAMMDHGQGMPSALRETTDSSIAESLKLLEGWHGKEDGRLRYAFAPRFVLSCTEALMRQVGELALKHRVGIHTHASENPTECDVVREKTGMDNVAYFGHLGMLGPHTTLAHCVWLTANEHRLLRESKTCVCHCPGSNLKLASGYAKIPELLEERVSLALGSDGAACNNNLDIFTEMRLAALIHKPRSGPTAVSALQVLEMATLGGARAIGMEGEVGSLEVGKRADLAILDLLKPHSAPAGDDVVAQLVYSGQSRDVTDVMIDGRLVMKARELLTLDEAKVVAAGELHAARLAAATA
jgi:5-methylthioadenosine/S-adenosylhomocysteine deaminase